MTRIRTLISGVLRSRLDQGIVLGGLAVLAGIWAPVSPRLVASAAATMVVVLLVALRRSASVGRKRVAAVAGRVQATERRVGALADRTEKSRAALRSSIDDVAAGHREASKRVASASDKIDGLLEREKRLVRDVRSTGEYARATGRVLRSELDELRQRDADLVAATIPAQTPSQPRLSVAIPGYNRPDELRVCLASLVDQVTALGRDDVEIWIVDDRSIDRRAVEVAREYAEAVPFVGFVQNSTNIGLERNLIAACAPCTGDFLWVVGNDDIIAEGGVEAVLGAIENPVDVVLVAKRRVDRTGAHELSAAGTFPEGIDPGSDQHYDTLSALTREVGPVSGLGFITTLIFRRAPFLAVDPTPYLGLTYYPQLGLLLEAFAHRPALARAVEAVIHRTQTAEEKAAEAIGRREGRFMERGSDSDARYFGASFAAMLQRVIDRSSLTVAEVDDWPEKLFGEHSLLDWLERNARGDAGDHPADVAADAERLFNA